MSRVRRGGRGLAYAVGLTGAIAGVVSCGGGGAANPVAQLTITTKAQLGKALFFDTTLSSPSGMACATCHSPAKAFTDPRPGPTSPGAVKGLFGSRNAPSICYMAYSPEFQPITGGGAVGGQFWDGRASDLPAQAKFPMVNPVEMNNPSLAAVVSKVRGGAEAQGMKLIYGAGWFSDPTTAINDIVDALATFERTPAVSPFSSKYDAYINGTATLTADEQAGLLLFSGKGNCATCHPNTPSADGTPPLFTNFTYFNLGIPKNLANPYYKLPQKYNPAGANYIDIGLQTATATSLDAGKFMVPTLRNIALTGPYFHNGIYTSLGQVLNFYNSRNTGSFGAPEVAANVDTADLGNLQLTSEEELQIIAFLNTLTDGYQPSPSRP